MPGKNLTRDEARERADLLSVDHYDVELDLTTSDTTFRTVTTVTFSASTAGAGTFIDLVAASVESVSLNGEPLEVSEVVADDRIALTGLAEQNTLRVEATGAYTNTGEGLHRFVDPADGEVYLYTQFEVADSRRMFSVFEQPDLKATFAFTVTAPAHWQVVSNSPTPEPSPVRDGVATWSFGTTPRIASYITALVAGPYDVVRSEVTSRGGTIPLGVFCRRSLSQYLDADNLLDTTRRGFEFFEREFDCAYPFEKYDQIFTPEFNAGAMENAGAVTFSEIYVFRSKVSESVVERRALTVLHELAHMWFGNLVTMRWWDDLWLNESFAEWASTTCQAEATAWESAWTTFGTAEKGWAYRQDQLSTTHPIVAPIRDLHDVEVNFDGITYAKGASVLKQLVAFVGREAFTNGLRSYFQRHAWGNTTLSDLLIELEKTSGRDLTSWSQAWLETAGTNTLRPEVEVDDAGVITAAAILQTAPGSHPTLRPHRLAVGLYDVRDGELVRVGRHEVDVDGERTELPELVGEQQPDLLLVNDDDLAYAKVRLDERSLATALAHPRGFTDSLPRSLVLGAAWDMTRDGEMGGRDYLRLALASLPGETDSTLLRVLLAQLATTTSAYVAPEHRDAAQADVTATLRDLAEAAEAGGDAQFQLFVGYAGAARSEEDARHLRAVLEGEQALPGLAVDTELRWTLLTALAATGYADAAELAAERERDNTATGREREVRALASRPTTEAKEQAWATAVDDDAVANTVMRAAALGFQRTTDPEVLRPFVDRYLQTLRSFWDSRTHALGEAFVEGFFPFPLSDEQTLAATEAWLAEHAEDGPGGLVRLVAENRDAVARALRAQAADRAAG